MYMSRIQSLPLIRATKIMQLLSSSDPSPFLALALYMYILDRLRNVSNGINVISCSVVRVPKRLKKYLWV